MSPRNPSSAGGEVAMPQYVPPRHPPIRVNFSRTDGSIRCWGSNAAGQTNAPATGVFVEIASGNDHTCAIDEAGAVHCWGANGSGQADEPVGVFGPG